MALSLRAWVNKHISAINEVRPLNHQVFCDSLRDTTAFDSFLGALDAEGDGEQWITTKNGHHVLIDGEGTVKAGMGGKFTGEKISSVGKKQAAKSSSVSASKSTSSTSKLDKDIEAVKNEIKRLSNPRMNELAPGLKEDYERILQKLNAEKKAAESKSQAPKSENSHTPSVEFKKLKSDLEGDFSTNKNDLEDKIRGKGYTIDYSDGESASISDDNDREYNVTFGHAGNTWYIDKIEPLSEGGGQ